MTQESATARLLVFLVLTSGLGLARVAHATIQEPPATATPPVLEAPGAPFFLAVRVQNMDAAIDWYTKVLGLEPLDTYRAPDGTWTIVNLANAHFHVEIVTDQRNTAAERPLGLFKVGFAVDDVEPVADRYEAAFGSRPNIVDFENHGTRLLQLRDPEGNVLQLSSPLTQE